LNLSAVVFCECDTVLLFSVIFHVVTAVRKIDFMLDKNETPGKWRLVFVKKKKHYVMQ
jgi:hypothetical protein